MVHVTRRSLPLPFTPVGFRRDGRPIYPVLGASPDDPTVRPTDEDPAPQAGVSQEDLARLLAREKSQGGRAAVRKLLGELGFETAEALTAYVAERRAAEQAAAVGGRAAGTGRR
ncbi:hypothetical protein RKE29_06725 [Streptomyces sp. B1866]|uniref:hypothetical protein n=1 Tax=Streptomyces sp. B1866 TaxID=3075431 RepID=UPI00288C909D|nr:hypothetical protein [Streptomyces sp. B1866]MDT3396336.1 hypothetical protein [Streptomyces sp. B1866]